jgi:hypothetical protein
MFVVQAEQDTCSFKRASFYTAASTPLSTAFGSQTLPRHNGHTLHTPFPLSGVGS